MSSDGGANPFALAWADRPGGISVESAAERRFLALLRPHLRPDGDPPRRTLILAVTGEYGSGKTHLLSRIAALRPDPERVTVCAARPDRDGFRSVYRQVIGQLGQATITHRVRRHYGRIVADAVGAPPGYHEDLVEGRVDPADAVGSLGLMASRLQRTLHDRLIELTGTRAYGTALTLLLEPGHDTLAWDWLRGLPPHAALREHGIATAIDSDESALRGLAALAGLHRGIGHRLALVVDEVDRPLLGQFPPSVHAAFRGLLDDLHRCGGVLVLASVPQALELLSPDTRQRITEEVQLARWTDADVAAYVAEVWRRTGRAGPPPFGDRVRGSVARIAAGNPRKIIELLYQLHQRQAEAPPGAPPPTVADVVATARSHIDVPTLEEARTEIGHALFNEAIPYLLRPRPGEPAGSDDYWIPSGGYGAGCQLIVTDSVLTEEDVDRLRAEVDAVHAGSLPRRAAVVIVGYLSDDLRDRFGGATGIRAEPVVYDRSVFRQVLISTVRVLLAGLEPGVESAMAIRLDRIGRQQAESQRRFDEYAAAHEAALQALERRVRNLTDERAAEPPAERPRPRPAAEPAGAAAEPALPAAVDEPIDDVLGELAKVPRLDPLLARVFAVDDAGTAADDARATVQARVQRHDLITAIGLVTVLAKLVRGFRDGVAGWYARQPAGARLGADARRALDDVCHNYDAIFSYLPVLDHLHLVVDLAAGPGAGGSRVVDLHRHRRDLYKDLESLAGRVRRELLQHLAENGDQRTSA
ncbi:hypothetical protein GCM10010123_41480 [Pilimelia anulata]|uniref:Uncharacterized protein n=1 Tax=Pilimelia anulata TaxID=53371 RepID=A0A8J3FCU3_9ACTN|nr:hypothetical protein [Pilimelia anulata]GGK07311.1 hypothetical protein GCM10010123_41480 [Pilimelia anulata]